MLISEIKKLKNKPVTSYMVMVIRDSEDVTLLERVPKDYIKKGKDIISFLGHYPCKVTFQDGSQIHIFVQKPTLASRNNLAYNY